MTSKFTNILYLTYEDIITQPIIRSQVVSLLDFLSKQGVRSTLITLKDEKIDYNDGTSVNYVFLSHRLFLINVVLYAYTILRIVHKDDIIHVRSYIPMFALSMVKPFVKNKIIFDMRGILPEEFSYRNNGLKDKIQSKVFSFFENIFIKISDKIVVVSNPFKEHVLSKHVGLTEEKIVVIPTLSSKFEGKEQLINSKNKYFPKEEIVLFVYSGSLNGWQNFNETVALFKGIHKYMENARLVVFTKECEKALQILSHTLDKSLYRVDSLSYEELNASLKGCDFGFMLRENHIVNKVASPIKFSDYINSNTFVIATDHIGDISSIILKNNVGCVVPDINLGEEEIKILVRNIIKTNQISKRNKEQSFKKIQNIFGLENVGKKYQIIYKEIKK